MKQYVIDELRYNDYEKLKAYMENQYGAAGVMGIFWIPLDESLLTDTQKAHSECLPMFFALELEPAKLSCELLVRTKNRVRCDCIQYATKEQRNWLIDYIDRLFVELEIKS